MASVPIRFISFTISFLADGKLVDTQQMEYGEDTARIEYPEIPPKEGYFGTWQTVENETVTENIQVVCTYKPYITVLSSEKK